MVYRGLYSYRQRVRLTDNEYEFPNIFSYCFCTLSEFVKDIERKVWCVKAAHLHNAAHALSSPSRCLQLSRRFRYLWYCVKKQIECGLASSVLLSTTIRVITAVKMLSASNWATSQSARSALVIEYVSSIHPWANSRCWISQSERALCFSYVIKWNLILLEDNH